MILSSQTEWVESEDVGFGWLNLSLLLLLSKRFQRSPKSSSTNCCGSWPIYVSCNIGQLYVELNQDGIDQAIAC
ncbi:hypothetical protein K1719_017339 [Acacia pycnantha]|nr:hypothetical protein K1719_017339 [Acacia pycnantha]